MAVADTTFLIDVLAGKPSALAKLDDLVARQQTLWLPAPALHELYYGAGLHREAARERARVEELERAMPSVAFDGAAARVAGTLEADFEGRGRRPGRVDVQVAAIALVHGEPVLTQDKRFPRPPGLVVEAY